MTEVLLQINFPDAHKNSPFHYESIILTIRDESLNLVPPYPENGLLTDEWALDQYYFLEFTFTDEEYAKKMLKEVESLVIPDLHFEIFIDGLAKCRCALATIANRGCQCGGY